MKQRLGATGLSFIFALSMAACGGGDGGSNDGDSDDETNAGSGNSDVSANGIWYGTAVEEGTSIAVAGVLYEGDLVAASDEGLAYVGDYTVAGNSLNGDMLIYGPNGGGSASYTLTAEPEQSIEGTFSTSYGTSGTVALTYDPLYERNVSIDDAVGTWTVTDGATTIAVTLNPNGRFFGSSTQGCNYSGDFALADPGKNVFTLDLEITGCQVSGSYDGYAALRDSASRNSELVVGVANESLAWGYILTK